MVITGCWLLDGRIPPNAGCPCNRAQNRTNAVRFLRPVVSRDILHLGGISRPEALQACNDHAPPACLSKDALPLPFRKMDLRDVWAANLYKFLTKRTNYGMMRCMTVGKEESDG